MRARHIAPVFLLLCIFARAQEAPDARVEDLVAAVRDGDVKAIQELARDKDFVARVTRTGVREPDTQGASSSIVNYAVRSAPYEVIYELLKAGFGARSSDEGAGDALYYALERDDRKIIKLLASSVMASDISKQPPAQDTALAQAIRAGDAAAVKGEIVRLTALDSVLYTGFGDLLTTPLQIAEDIHGAGSEIVKLLLRSGAGTRAIPIDRELFPGATCNESRVNLRTRPLVGTPVLRQLNPGDRVTVLAMSPRRTKVGIFNYYWFQVEVAGGPKGWMYGVYLDLDVEAAR